jgi:hypothetical protein
MDQLWAIKRDFDPFKPTAAGFIGAARFLKVVRCTIYRCSYCATPFEFTWGPQAAFIGSGERNSWRCKKRFYDDSQEWPEMSGKDRQLFLVPISVAGWLGGTIIIGAIAAYVMYLSPSFEQAFAGAFIVVILLIPLLFWFGYCGLHAVGSSVQRFRKRENSMS